MAILNSKSFNKACTGRPPHVDVPCEELKGDVRIGRLNAAMVLKLNKHYKNVPKDAAGQPLNDDSMAEYYVLLLAMAIIDEDQDHYLLNDEGKALLGTLSLNSLITLGTAAMVFNELAEPKDGKKKPKRGTTSTTPTTSSPFCSRGPSAIRIRTTCSSN